MTLEYREGYWVLLDAATGRPVAAFADLVDAQDCLDWMEYCEGVRRE